MATGLTEPWKIQANDVIIQLDNSTDTVQVHRYRVRSVPIVDWPNAATAVRCYSDDGLVTNLILHHDERVLVCRASDHYRERRAWARRKDRQS